MSEKNKTPTNSTHNNQQTKPEVVHPPQNIYIQNSEDSKTIIIKSDIKKVK